MSFIVRAVVELKTTSVLSSIRKSVSSCIMSPTQSSRRQIIDA